MSPLRLNGSTSGYSQINAPDVAGDQAFTLPTTGGVIVTETGTQTLINKTITTPNIQGGTLQNATISSTTIQGGCSVLDTPTSMAGLNQAYINSQTIPTWVKQLTVILSGVSTTGASSLVVRLGTSAGLATTGYISHWGYAYGIGTGATTTTTGFGVWTGADTELVYTNMIITKVSSANNEWVASYGGGLSTGANVPVMITGGGRVALPGVLTNVHLGINGAGNFDAGTVNVLYQG